MGLSLESGCQLCFSSLDLKRKGIGNVFSVQMVQLGCDSWNNAGNEAVAIVAVERKAL